MKLKLVSYFMDQKLQPSMAIFKDFSKRKVYYYDST